MQGLGRSGQRAKWRLRLVAVAAAMCVSAGLVPNVASATITAANDAGYVESFAPVADAYIRSDAPTTNFSDSNLRVKGADPGTRSYLQFQVGAPTKVWTAELWLFDGGDPALGGGVAVRRAGNSWSETGITWSTAPVPQSAVVSVAQSVGKWVKFDVSSVVVGSGVYTFVLTGTGARDQSYSYASREGYPNWRPRLVLGVVDYDRPVRTPGPARVALFGDSITAQYSLAAVPALQAQGYDVRARGVGGSGLLDASECQGQRATTTLTQDDPDIVILESTGNYRFNPPCDPMVQFGTEAFYREWQRAAQQVTDILRSRGADVVWMLIPPAPAGSPREITVARINDIYRSIALRTPGVGIVDAFNPFGGKTFDASVRAADGVHLNASGVTLMASLVNRAVVDTTNGVSLPPPVLVTPASLRRGRVEAGYLAALTATGGVVPLSWSLASGSLPPGLTLSSAGALAGTPTMAGTFTFTVQVADARTGKDARSFVVNIAPPPVSVSTTSSAGGMVGFPYSTTVAARGGVAPYSWTVTSGSLPAGLTLSSSGAITGTPRAAGTFEFTVQVADSDDPIETGTRSLSVTVAPPPVSISTASLAGGMVASPYSRTLSGTGGLPPYSWSLATGSLPPGVTLRSSGTIAGTPTTAGTFFFTVRVADSASPPRVSTKALFITVAPAPLRITTASLPAAKLSQPYVAKLAATGGTAPYRWTRIGALPAGLQLNRKAGVLFGTPTKTGTVTFTMQVRDTATPEHIVTKVFSITVR